ncbi:MAG TPA: AMP-binding protein [Steroidobacter sp.]|uniref:AMP-binding protein n=1 Tax=Steroidobacter sp. TaxID=1978227 RepID=UPI002ED85F58
MLARVEEDSAILHLTQPLQRAAVQYPNRVATVFQDRTTTYAQLAARVARMASALRELGLKEGDRVGLLAHNSDRFVELLYAVWWAGGVVNPINIRWNEWEMVRALDDCQTRILFVDDQLAPSVARLFDRSEHLEKAIHAGDGNVPSGMFSCEQLIRDSQPGPDARRHGEQLAAIFYSGGSRELTKGVMLSHANMMSSVLGGLERLAVDGDVGLHAAPLFHLAGMMFMLALTLRATTQVIEPGFQVDDAVKLIVERGVTNTLLVPTMIHRLLNSADVDKLEHSRLRRLGCVASASGDHLAALCRERLPSVIFSKVYGVPEMAPLVSILTYDDDLSKPAGAVGTPSLTTEVRILGEDGKEVARGKTGELVVRGAGLMQGYWNKPAETAKAIRDGWLHTGDAAYMNEAGQLFVIGKLSDMIVTGGENVICSEVESVLLLHPSIAACAVIGLPNEQWGQSVHAIIVPRPGRQLPRLEAIRAHCRNYIAGYKCPVSVEFRDTLPRSANGEILKSILQPRSCLHVDAGLAS